MSPTSVAFKHVKPIPTKSGVPQVLPNCLRSSAACIPIWSVNQAKYQILAGRLVSSEPQHETNNTESSGLVGSTYLDHPRPHY